ncbi:MAG: type IV pilus biogenesis/stability protein PilW [Gammaproteobacteria bacterium]
MEWTTSRYRGLLAMLLLASLAAGCASTPSDPDAVDAKRRTAELNTQLGNEYLSRGEYEVALEKLKRAIRADDDYAPAHTVIAVLYEQIGEEELAGEHYRKAVRAAPDNGDVNNNYGAYLCRSGRSRDAFAHFERALEDPFYRTPAVALTNAGSCALEEGDYAAAEAYLRKALGFDDDFPDALLTMASLNLQRGDSMRARAFLQRYEVAANPSAEALMLGYRNETRLGDERGARRYRDALLNRYPSSVQADELRREGMR